GTESFAGGERDPLLAQDLLDGDAVGQPEPDEERSLRARLNVSQGGKCRVPSPLVGRAAFVYGALWAGERRDTRLLHRREDSRERVILDRLDAPDEVFVSQRETETPAGHSVALRHAEEL